MKQIILNGKKMTDKETTHKYFKRKFDLPKHYGENLDALWDCLTEKNIQTTIILKNVDELEENLGEYAESIIQLFEDLSEEYDNYTFEIDAI